MVEDVSKIRTRVHYTIEYMHNSSTHNADMLKTLALEELEGNLADYIKRENLKTYKKSLLEFVLIVSEVYEYVRSDEKCTVNDAVAWFDLEDEKLIKHALKFIGLNYKIGPDH